MPLFTIYKIIENAQNSCREALGTYMHKRSLIAEVKSYTMLATRLCNMHKTMQAETDNILILQLSHEVYSADTLLTQQTYCRMLDHIKYRMFHCNPGNSNAMGDLYASERNVLPLVQECFDANIILARNVSVLNSMKTLFVNTVRNVIANRYQSEVMVCDIDGMYALFAYVMRNRIPVFTNILDSCMHSYVFVNELTQLLIALHDAREHSTSHTLKSTLVVNLSNICMQYTRNGVLLVKKDKRLLPILTNNTAVDILNTHEPVRLEVILATQIMIAAIIQREIGHIIVRYELTPPSEQLSYDYVAELSKYNLLMSYETAVHAGSRSLQTQEEISHLLLMYRLKHMLHLRVTYLIISELQRHTDDMLKLLNSHIAEWFNLQEIEQAQDELKRCDSLLVKMLSKSGNIACMIADDMLLNMRTKMRRYIQSQNLCVSEDSIKSLVRYLLENEDSTIATYITRNAIVSVLQPRRLCETIAAVLGNYDLHNNATFIKAIHNIFNNEQVSQFTKYLCSRAGHFIVALCHDRQFIHGTSQTYLSGDIHMEQDAMAVCRVACLSGITRAHAIDRQLNILNDANNISNISLQGIHLSYCTVLNMLNISDMALYSQLKSRMYSIIFNVLCNLHKFTALGIIATIVLKSLHVFV